MAKQQLAEQFRVRPIILGSAGIKCLSITSQPQGVNRVKLEKLVTHQMINERAPTLLQADQDFALGMRANVDY